MGATPITVAQARECVLRTARRLEPEQVGVLEALDRVLAQDLLAARDVPAFACSAMDGYAVRAGPSGRSMTVVGESRAGAPARARDGEGVTLREGEAIRISTGAIVPAGATAVIRQEDIERRGGVIQARAAVATSENIRHAGEDLRGGSTVLGSGTVLGAAELGAAVAAGAARVLAVRRPRVAVLCTGDELRAPGERLAHGEIHNSNAPMLVTLVTRCGAVAAPPECLPDQRDATGAALTAALARSDVVILSGGVSAGPHDHVKGALAAIRVSELFWGVALQPGKPTWFGARDEKLVFGLPGNPVSAVVAFLLFARPALAALQGAVPDPMVGAQARLGVGVLRRPRREQALCVRLEHRAALTVAFPNRPQGSHRVSSLLGAHALALIPPGEGELEAGSLVALVHLPG